MLQFLWITTLLQLGIFLKKEKRDSCSTTKGEECLNITAHYFVYHQTITRADGRTHELTLLKTLQMRSKEWHSFGNDSRMKQRSAAYKLIEASQLLSTRRHSAAWNETLANGCLGRATSLEGATARDWGGAGEERQSRIFMTKTVWVWIMHNIRN